jgi:hypothetical protein
MPNIVLVLIDNREIEPMTNQHEWKSVSFIHQSHSLHYGRFMLSSLKEGRPLIIKPIIRKVPLQECLGRLGLICLDQDNSNQLNQENPFYRELTRDDLSGISWIKKQLRLKSDEFDLSSEDSEDEEESPLLFTFFVKAFEPLSSESSDQEEPLALPIEIPENTPVNTLFEFDLDLNRLEFDLDLNRQGLISYKNSRFNPCFENFDNDEDFDIFHISFEPFLF